MGQEEKGVRHKPQNIPTIPTIHHNQDKFFIYPMGYQERIKFNNNSLLA